ncbi:MAG: protein translocase subunit SecD [Capsulimonadaceae bacterium]|nr:protein translocase subunit SecD [Capsulimonadaceae bacterium]
MKREGLWLGGILVLVALSIFALVKLPPHYGLDIKGGARAILQAVPTDGQPLTEDTHKVLLDIITRRVNSTGVAEPSIQPKGRDQFIVELPNASNKDDLIKQIGTTAQLEFRYFQDVKSDRNRGARYSMGIDHVGGMEVYSFTDSATGTTFRDQAQIEQDIQKLVEASNERPGATEYKLPASLTGLAPSDRTLYFTPDQAKKADALGVELQAFKDFIADSPLVITGSDLEPNSHGQLDPQQGPVVTFNTKPESADKMGDFTGNHVNEIMAILLDNRVLTAPKINSRISDNGEITGGFKNIQEAVTLANLINAGALPVPLKIVQNVSVEATLGKSALKNMTTAGLIGFVLVLVFMAGYYLLPGAVADIALVFYGLFTLAVFKGALSWFIPPVTLTLPGIAGFILSVGMAVDANILIFERLKEELRNGKPLRQAIDAGFKRAFTAIRDSNICTIITCTILYSMGSPTVKGFALTLGIGVVISLFTAITVTRTLLYLLVDAHAGNHPEWFGLGRQWFGGKRFQEGTNVVPDASKPQLNVIHNRKWFYLLSCAIIIPGIIFWFMGGLKRSIEFTGGTQVEVVFDRATSQQAIGNALSKAGLNEYQVQMASGGTLAYISVKNSGPNDYLLIASKSGPGLLAADATTKHPALDSLGIGYHTESHSLVGGVISKELTSNAFQAVIVASILIVLYLALAFSIGGFVAGLRFGTSAIIALLHDVLVLIGSFAILGYFLNWEIDSLFITATLTVVGFSVHDTIVIFDRLRENLRHRIKGESFEALANRSILQSFARSINTSFTVILTLVAMMIFGEPSTRLLVTALLIGIISGTYSSIFNATPILVDWENYLASKRETVSESPLGAAKPAPKPVAPAAPAPSLPSADAENRPARSAKPKRGGAQRRF